MSLHVPGIANLVISGIVTTLSASIDLLKQSAPTVSMANTGTSCHPTFSIPKTVQLSRHFSVNVSTPNNVPAGHGEYQMYVSSPDEIGILACRWL